MRDKQIEEMANEICSEYDCVIPCQNCAYYGYANCRDVKSAEKLYTAGYRKSTDLAREIFEEIEEGIKAAVSALQFENNPIHRKVKHEVYSSVMRFVKSVEEKYTEG